MNVRTTCFCPDEFTLNKAILFPLVLAVCSLLFTGCDQVSSALGDLGVRKVDARTTGDSISAFLTYQEALVGKNPDAVLALFGKPQGIFERRNGKVWMYARWCVEFDSNDQVARLERDVAATGIGGGAPSPSMALAARPTTPSQPSASPAGMRTATKTR